MNKKKLCFITSARSEYGLLKWLMRKVLDSEKFQMQLIVSGGHLLQEQGHTIDEIISDGFNPDAIVDSDLNTETKKTIAESMGRLTEKLASAFEQLSPDYLVVLGDRYELLPICSTAVVMRIPIIHLCGGDVTAGLIDDVIRNAVTMMAEIHFAGTQASADNIIRMRGSDKNVYVVGEPGLDSFYCEKFMTRDDLAQNLGLDIDKEWVLLTYHAETLETLKYNIEAINNCLKALMKLDGFQIVATYANADFGGKEINDILEEKAKANPAVFKVVPSLGHLRYISFMRQVSFVIGNSSSGIVETASLKIPTVNIGDRQKGRYQCSNIVQCDTDLKSIEFAIENALKLTIDESDLGYWGDGHSADNIINILEKVI